MINPTHIIIILMVDFTKRTALQQLLIQYYQIYWLRVFNNTLYFIIQICLFIILTFLPIKITFNYQLSTQQGVQQNLDIIILLIFILHIYLYLDHSVRKLVQNPQIKKKILFRSYVIKLKWLSIFNMEFMYDLICLFIAIYELVTENNQVSRLLELVYLLKIYKIKVFHDRFLSYIIGTPFYIVYNVFYGLFILIIIVSYVGCAFFQIDKTLNENNYEYPFLLWVNVSAWPDIINQGFDIQLLYAMYWSLGTASSAAYGNVSASAPPDIIYNIFCLYFEGFLFGFYLSRIHSLPEILSKKEDELLQIFQQFQEHKEEIKKSDTNERIQRQLYFKILCSLEYQEYRKKNVNEIEKLLPVEYLVEIKSHVFKDLLHTNPLNLWGDEQLRARVSLKIQEVTTEAGEELYDYTEISRNDLIFIREGEVTTCLAIDQGINFPMKHVNYQFFGFFQFILDFVGKCTKARCENYCNLYVLKRKDYKELLTIEQKLDFDARFGEMLAFQNNFALEETLGKYGTALAKANSNLMFLNGSRKAEYVQQLLGSTTSTYHNQRKRFKRSKCESKKFHQRQTPKQRSVGVQCDEEDSFYRQMDRVLIL